MTPLQKGLLETALVIILAIFGGHEANEAKKETTARLWK
jgi:hypothetical protein